MTQQMQDFTHESNVLALAILEWHGGGGSAVYQIGSHMYAGHLQAVANMFAPNEEYSTIAERAIMELRANDTEESDILADQLESWINCYNALV